MVSVKKPRVSVIVLNWNGIRYTVKCIKSLKKQSYRDFELIVVDNGSTKDNSISVLRKMRGIRLVLNSKNLGFAGGVNSGVQVSSASDYVALLNNDALAHKDWLKELVAALDKNPELGEAMSKVYNRYSGSKYFFGYYGTLTNLLFIALYDFPVSEKGLIPTFGASGGAMIYRKKLIGLPFDSDYFIYSEDNYLSWLLRLKGYGSVWVPKSIVRHEGEATIKGEKALSGFFAYLGERNRLMNIFLFYSPFTLIRLLPLLLLTTAFLNIYNFRKLHVRLRSYLWLLAHLFSVLSKRFKIQRQRKVHDSVILPYMSSKLFDETHFKSSAAKLFVRALNRFSRAYCMLLGIKSVERNRPKEFQ